MFNKENQIYKNTSFSVSRKLFSSIAWKSINATERSVLFELMGIACDRRLTLTFNSHCFPISKGEIISPEAYLCEQLSVNSEELNEILTRLESFNLIKFKTESIENIQSQGNDSNIPQIQFPNTLYMNNNQVLVIQINDTLTEDNSEEENCAPEPKAVVEPKVVITPRKEISKPEEPSKKSLEEKISLDQFNRGEYPNAAQQAAALLEKYSLTEDQYQSALAKFCRTKSQSGYLHMTPFMFKFQFDLYIKKNLKHIVV